MHSSMNKLSSTEYQLNVEYGTSISNVAGTMVTSIRKIFLKYIESFLSLIFGILGLWNE